MIVTKLWGYKKIKNIWSSFLNDLWMHKTCFYDQTKISTSKIFVRYLKFWTHNLKIIAHYPTESTT